jgi:hypothetical protein
MELWIFIVASKLLISVLLAVGGCGLVNSFLVLKAPLGVLKKCAVRWVRMKTMVFQRHLVKSPGKSILFTSGCRTALLFSKPSLPCNLGFRVTNSSFSN